MGISSVPHLYVSRPTISARGLQLTAHLASEIKVIRRFIRQNNSSTPFNSLNHLFPIINSPDIEFFSFFSASLPKVCTFFTYQSSVIQTERGTG